jgi:CO/xanthine dehydrogenase FAD-binding subunit
MFCRVRKAFTLWGSLFFRRAPADAIQSTLMDVLLPRTLGEALEMKAAHAEAVPIAGGTDLMVELNFDRLRPPLLMDVSRLPELREWRREDGNLFLGSGVTYSRIVSALPAFRPLVEASRTVGSPQIRNRGTVGGNLGTASPAGDALPVLAAYDAEVVLVRAGGRTRSLPWNRFMVGPKKTVIEPAELILGARWRITRGPGSFSKVGTRNAMVIAVASLCLVIDEDRRTVRVALGSVGPTILRAPEAEVFAARALADAGTWEDPAVPLARHIVEGFGERVAAAATPIDDVRGTAAYRRHACAVMARRALTWALQDRRS